MGLLDHFLEKPVQVQRLLANTNKHRHESGPTLLSIALPQEPGAVRVLTREQPK